MSNEGKKVKIHYNGTLDNGEKFDSSYDRGEPIEFVCMAGTVIPGFDQGVKDMKVGEKKTVHIEPADAYGEYNQAAVQVIPETAIPNADKLPVGEMIYMTGPGGMPTPVKVVSVEDGKVTLDFNHPLAGKALNFELELISVEE